jgi:copper chaperone CopZ
MITHTYATNLRCPACLDAVRPHLDGVPGLRSWSADMNSPEKRLTVEGDVAPAAVRQALAGAGYDLLGEVAASPPAAAPEPAPSYYPLLLILGYLLGVTAAVEWLAGSFDPMRAMRHFMAGFFLVFSFFKLLDLPAFASAFGMYDIVAGRFPAYATAYPFIELALGALYLLNLWPAATNVATLVVMGVGTIGVVRALRSGRQIRCACLGAVINLPVATVTLIEDAGMAAMAAAMLAMA